MAKATALVEQHLATPGYGVEQLAADLCMERTGLYKKLTALIEQPPVVFIRSIRLQRAAELLRQGAYSVNEVAELTGFSSVSYFRKCFQREFGCKPSEYTEQQKNE
jgi:AraC-like DNA-binding protein